MGSPTRYKFMQDEMGAKKRYRIGRYFMGAVSDDVQGLAISSNNAYGVEMSNLQESQVLSLLTTEKLEHRIKEAYFLMPTFSVGKRLCLSKPQ